MSKRKFPASDGWIKCKVSLKAGATFTQEELLSFCTPGEPNENYEVGDFKHYKTTATIWYRKTPASELKDEITRRYQEIDRSYGSTGKNLYTCNQGHDTLMVHLCTGVTPGFISCKKCGTDAMTNGYDVPQKGKIYREGIDGTKIYPIIKDHWVRPSLSELIQISGLGHQSSVDHILRGGLVRLSWKREVLAACN